ncbi:hypothetical protein [Rugamonas sp. DEMB1]|uniref:hypothetical protein n=1 Tax=Rugamonas sp. DEMB1 TaxID=3039386 RepID=UPI00244D37FB|nr:hypothetical protein [Rugamonas sp. DEMB1]WGG48689.1 hypothetical protein QC826_18725 [Rugamonas sp. DEMB1]
MKPGEQPAQAPAPDRRPRRPHRRPGPAGGHFLDEPDIGSGEKTPGERDTEEQIRRIPPLPRSGAGMDTCAAPLRS